MYEAHIIDPEAAQDAQRPWGEALQEAKNYYLEKYRNI